MSGLKRIVLIDTHLPGLVELKVDGHTNICGTNASGKTTLQRLIPVFYGESPNKVVPATRDNFQTWYLPRESSFIIYEYQRLNGKMCMAVLTSSSTGVVYRLFEKGFSISDFIGNDIAGAHSVPMAELIRAVKRDNIVVTKALNTKEFRAVIQNDRTVMALSSNKRDLLTAARYFSLCEPEARLRHIEKLIKAVHSKEGKMETIKAMIAAILEEDGVQTPNSKLSKSHVDNWIKECLLIKEFSDLMPQYKKLQTVDAKLSQTETRLSQLKHQISVDLSILSEAIVKAETDHGVYKGQLSELSTNFEQNRDTLNRQVSQAKGDVQNAEQHLDKIDADFNQWQDKNIETHQANIVNIPTWQAQLQSINEHHTLLTAEHQDIEAQYHKRLASLEQKQSKQLAYLSEQKDQINSQLRTQQLAEQQAAQQIKSEQDSRWHESSSDFERQINDHCLQLQTVKTAIELSGPTSTEQQAMHLQEAGLEEAQAEEDHTRHEVQAVQAELQQVKYQQIASHEKLNKARSKVGKTNARVLEIESWLYPENNTLLEFLRKDYQGWETQLGKVINPDLLARTDLAPALTASVDQLQAEQGHLYGLLLDTDVIVESEQIHSEKQLQQQLDVAVQEHKTAGNGQAEQEADLEKINLSVQQLEQKLTSVNSQCQFKEQTRKRLQDERTQLKIQHKQALLERKQQGEQALIGLQKTLDKLRLNKQQALDSHTEQCHDEKMEHELHWQQVIADIEQKLEQINQQFKQVEQDHKGGVKTCKKWYQDELANRDVDVEQIAELKQRMLKLKDDIDVTNKHRDDVADYNRWYDLVFTKQKTNHLNQLSKAKDVKGKAERLIDEQASSYHQQKQLLQQQLQKLEKALIEQRELANGINGLKNQFVGIHLPKTTAVVENASARARLSEARELFDQQSRAIKDIDHYVNEFDSKIAQKSGISLTDAWEHSRRECLLESEHGFEKLNSRKMVVELDRLLNVLVPQHLEGVRNNGLNFGNDLTQYYKILADIDKRIVSQSKRISKEVDQELFLDGVSESQVIIRSKISEFDFWPKLQRFNKLHQEWLNAENTPLPDEEYMQTIREVLDILGRVAISGGISQLLDIELHLKEGNSNLIIRTDRQLNESSSHGMAYLILCKFLLAFTRLLRGNSKAIIHWPIDEIGTLANKNVKKIFDACKANQITVLGAFPNPESEVLHFFENRYLIDKDAHDQKLRMIQPKVSRISERLKQRQQSEVSL